MSASDPPSAACMDDDLVNRFVYRLVKADEGERVRAHLPGCPRCRRLVSEMVKRMTQPIAVQRPR
jgi:hypothetical protein